MSVAETIKKEDVKENEIIIRLSDIVQALKNSRWLIFLIVLIGLLIGAIYALSQPDIYTGQVTVMPELQSKGAGALGSLGSLAGLAGFGFDNMSGQDAIRPDLYPDVLRSVPFALALLKQPVYSKKLQTTLLLESFMKRIKAESFFGKLFPSSSKNDGEAKQVVANDDPKNFSKAIQVTKEQEALIRSVQLNVSSIYDKKTGILTVTAVEPDPVVAATVARLSLDYLTNYITTYRTEKARKQVTFLTQRVNEAKKRYQSAEYALSDYRDRNRNLYLNIAKLDEQRLQADYLLEQSVYNELSKQLEQAKIKVQDETPVFKVLEPPTIPLRKTGPKRTMIVVGFGVVGVIIGIILALVRWIRLHSRLV